MIKTLTICLLTLLCINTIAQQDYVLSGRIYDNKTNEVLPCATIIHQNKSVGTISNPDGYFSFSLFNVNKTDSIIISYLGYQSVAFTIEEHKQDKAYSLVPLNNAISEVTITAEKFKLKSFIKEIISDYNKNKKTKPHIAISHYREKAKENGSYIMYMESIGYTVYAGKEVNASPLSNYKFFCENSRCHVVKPEWVKYKEYKSGITPQNVSPSGGSNLNIFRYLETNGVLSQKHYGKYKYSLDSTYFVGNTPIYCINFIGDIASGTMHILPESMQILKIDCSTDKYWSNPFHKRLDADVSIQFTYFENTPFVSSISACYKHKELEHINTLSVLVQKFNEFELNSDQYWSMNTYDSNPYIDYSPTEWNNYTIGIDSEYAKIESDIMSGNTSLEDQFVNFSGRWFFRKENESELARTIIKELKINF